MSHYFFNIVDNGEVLPDSDGRQLADDRAAREQALITLGQKAHDELPDGDHRIFVVDVLDAERRMVLSASLSLMVTYPRRR